MQLWNNVESNLFSVRSNGSDFNRVIKSVWGIVLMIYLLELGHNTDALILLMPSLIGMQLISRKCLHKLNDTSLKFNISK